LLLLLFLGVADDRADTESIGNLILEQVHFGGNVRVIQVQVGLEVLNLFTHLMELFLEILRGACELFNQLVDFRAECLLEVARDLTSHLDDGFLDFFIVALTFYLVLDAQNIIQNLLHIGLGLSLFLCHYSDIAVLQEVSKLLMEE
jgi:hypothetical protein